MKITKYGTVTISEAGVKISDFTIDAEGSVITAEEAGVFICKWAVDFVAGELHDVTVKDSGGNVWNGVEGLPK